MTSDDRRVLIERYRDGYSVVERALAGASDAELDARPAPHKWSSREIAHHLADSEMTSAIRLRRLIAEDDAVIHGYDEEEFARRLYYDRPIGSSLEAFRSARACTVELLERLTPEQWARSGTHSESGPYSVERWLEIYAAHAHGHAVQIIRARASAKTRERL
jgi:hypothetical protein